MKLQNNCKYLISSFLILAFCLLQCCLGQSTTVRPYKFGFTIDEQQHRSEQRDERGIVMGEFGFITADGIYHVTVYATDEQGRFRILAMKNYPYESPPKTVEVMVQPKIPPKTTTTTPKSLPRHNFYTEACSGCSLLNGNNKPKEAGGTDGKTLKSDIRPLSKALPNPSFSSAASPKISNSSPSTGSTGKISGLDKENVLFSFTADTNITKPTLIETLAFKDFNTLKNAVKSQQLFTSPSTLAPHKVGTPPDIQISTTRLAEESSEIVLSGNSNLKDHINISINQNKSVQNISPESFQTLDQTLKHRIIHHNKHQYQELEPSVTDKSQAKLTKNSVKSQQLFTRPSTLAPIKVGTPPDIQIRTTHLAEESSEIVLSGNSNLKDHINISNNQNKSVLNIPSKSFKTLDQTLKHNTTHHNKHQYQELAPSLGNKIQNKLTEYSVRSQQQVGTPPDIQIRTTQLAEESSKIVLNVNSNLKNHRNISNNQNKYVINIPSEAFKILDQTLKHNTTHHDKHQYQELAPPLTNKIQTKLTQNVVKSQQLYTSPSNVSTTPDIQISTTHLAEGSNKIALSVNSNLKDHRNILNNQNKSVFNILPETLRTPGQTFQAKSPPHKHKYLELPPSVTNKSQTILTQNSVAGQKLFTTPSTNAPSKVGTTPDIQIRTTHLAEESSKIVLSVGSNLKNGRNILNNQNKTVLNIPPAPLKTPDQVSNKNKQLHNAPPQHKHQHQVLALSITNNNGTSLYTDKTQNIINNVLNSLKITPNNLFKHKLPINSAEKENTLSKIPLNNSLEQPNEQNSKPRTNAPGNNLTKKPLTNAPTQSDGTEAVPLTFNSKTLIKHSEIQTTPTTTTTTLNKQYTTNPVVSKGINPKTSQAAQGASASPSNTKTTAGNAPPIMDIIMQKVLPTLMAKKGPTASSSPTQSTTLNNKANAVPSGDKPNSSKSDFDNPRKPGGSSGSTGVNGDGDLYRFKYILDYHGHSETGKRNGDKEGSYYVIGDDNVERTIEYVANEFGYQPRIRWRKLDSNEIKSKENTLKDYEFVWFKE